uniref:Uncharacterized protein n=1 Tax=Oreochromis aureus TaxID=47969 RepID=A0A668U3G1_OREAU
MYSSGYSQVSKHSPQAKKTMQYRSSSKSCGYYMRIVFFFSSLIQSLIIVSLVLFLVYGKTQDSACQERTQDLEERFSQLSLENVALKKQRTNLTNFLNVTLTAKARMDSDLALLRQYTNMSILYFHECEQKLDIKLSTKGMCPFLLYRSWQRPLTRFQLVNSNFTQSVQAMKMEMEEIAKERDNLNLETIKLRRDIATKEKQIQIYEKTSKDEFSQSLGSVYNVSRAFLHKIDSLFPAHIAFQLTCPKQREHLEQIRSNCTNLSREVEDKLQRYMDTVGNHVAGIQNENIRLKAENWRFSEDYRSCRQEHAGMVEQHKQNLDKLQQKHDLDQERLLKEKKKLSGEKEVLETSTPASAEDEGAAGYCLPVKN